jgi:spermidine synthase
MIDIQLIENSGGSLFENFISSAIETDKFSVKKTSQNVYRFIDKTKSFGGIHNEDNVNFIKYFYRKLFDLDFNSILISGLGLGVVPYICQNKTEVIDVVEIDLDVINFVNEIGHLNNNVHIINTDIYNFVPQRTYDVILFDHWSIGATEYDKEIFSNKFGPYLNTNGIISVPVIEQFRNSN